MRVALCGLLVLAVPIVLAAPAQAASTADELAGLFMQSCVSFVGNPDKLRAWVAHNHLPALPPPGQTAFLHGQAGIAYDATNGIGKFVILSGDDGSCAAIAQHAEPQQLISRIEQDWRDAGLPAVLTDERDDPSDARLHYRSYRAGQRNFVVSTTSNEQGPAMLMARIER